MFSGFLLCVAPIDFYHENAWLKHLVERPQLHDWLIALSSHKASAKCLEHLTTFQLTGCEEAPKKSGDDGVCDWNPVLFLVIVQGENYHELNDES